MRVLLDTHCWLWMQVAPEQFCRDALELIRDPETELIFSAASSWEIGIKYALGRLPLPVPPEEYMPDRMASSGVIPLPVHHLHALQVAGLPPHRRDPFDRLLVVQARSEGIPLLTADPWFDRYDVEVIRAR